MDWFYALGEKQCGPVTETQLEALLASGQLTRDTLVWHAGLADWQPLHAARPTPLAAPPVIAGAVPADHAQCVECRGVFPQGDMLFLNKSWVCATCKPIFLQRLAEGAAPPVATGGLYRQKKLLVTRSETSMPDRCVKCNAPANGFRLKRQLFWHHPGLYLLILISLLIYIIAALIVRKKAVLHIGLCEAHRTQRRWIIAGSWVAGLGGLGLLLAGIGWESWLAVLMGLIVMFAGLVVGAVLGPVVAASRIDKDVVKVRGVGPQFLAELPEWQD